MSGNDERSDTPLDEPAPRQTRLDEIELILRAQGQRLNDLRIAFRKQNEINKAMQELCNSMSMRLTELDQRLSNQGGVNG